MGFVFFFLKGNWRFAMKDGGLVYVYDVQKRRPRMMNYEV